MINENLEDFLSKLSNTELAFFFKHRKNEFMPNSQHKIHLELKKRNLSNSNVSDLIRGIDQTNTDNCPKCGSNNFQEIIDTEVHSTNYGGYETEIISRKCRICAYNAQKDAPISWRVKINRFLGKYAWKRLK